MFVICVISLVVFLSVSKITNYMGKEKPIEFCCIQITSFKTTHALTKCPF